MRLTVVRHATAGSKRAWSFPDLQRPLDPRGEEVAERLSQLLMRHQVDRLVSSPAVRCIQTLGAIAERRDMPIELCDSLGPTAGMDALVKLFTNVAYDNAVVCTHGEVIAPLLESDGFRAAVRATGIPRRILMTKGTAWRMELSPKGKLLKLSHLAPKDT